MRPTRLELEGFASFRDATTVDFTDADLFVLSGPTGAGKSSLIDAITFALYGTVARYNDRRLVEPVISKGCNEARVSLQFTVGDRGWTAVRVVRRGRTGGASTKEARLEAWRGDDPADARTVAGTADEVSRAVEEVLGLGYGHFTRTVVLPQGAFQHFLHGSRSERADLLNTLLDIGVFDTVASAARTRASTLAGQVAELQSHLDGDLAELSDQDVAAAAHTVAAHAEAIEHLDQVRPGLDDLLVRGRAEAERATSLRADLDVVGAVARPDGLDDVVQRQADSAAAGEAAAARLATAEGDRDRADTALDALPSADAVAAQHQRVGQLAEAATAVDDAVAALQAASAQSDMAADALAAAQVALEQADTALERARHGDLVAALVAGVHVGDDCPVCSRPLDAEVDVDPAALQAAQQAHQVAAAAVEAARADHTRATTAHARAEAAAAAATRTHDALRVAIDDSPLPVAAADLTQLTTRVAAATTQRDAARSAVVAARRAADDAGRTSATVATQVAQARATLDTTRDRVAAQGPPPTDPQDLDGSWRALEEWARERAAALTALAGEVEAAVTATRAEYTAAMADVRARLESLDVEAPEANRIEPIRDHVVAAHARATTVHEQVVARRERRTRALADLADRRREAAVAGDLGRLLDKRNFQRWLTSRAVTRLVVGATRHLTQLTDGAYSLTLDANDDFAIVDHTNAGELRPARSLSGGETFLASLSLALSLSEHVADLAAGGAARLESLFIDEGFGTLDAATIDTVRTALEELGASGRMVGVVTHVPALAEQLPVQFHVRKEAQTSVVRRVDT